MGERHSGPHRESKRRDFLAIRGVASADEPRRNARGRGQAPQQPLAEAERPKGGADRRRHRPDFLQKKRVFVVRRSHFGGPVFDFSEKEKGGGFCNPPTKTCAPNPFYFRLFKVPRDSAKKKSTFATQRYGISGFAGSYAPFLVRDLRRVSFSAPPRAARWARPMGKRNSGPHRESKRRNSSNSRGCVGGRTAAERQGQRAQICVRRRNAAARSGRNPRNGRIGSPADRP